MRMVMSSAARLSLSRPVRMSRAVRMGVHMPSPMPVIVTQLLDRRFAVTASTHYTHDSISISLIFNSVPATMRRLGSWHAGQRPKGAVITGWAPQAAQ